MAHRLAPPRLERLRRIGIDEFSYRKRHPYLTAGMDHGPWRAVWTAPDRTTATLEVFFDELGEPRRAHLECVTLDIYNCLDSLRFRALSRGRRDCPFARRCQSSRAFEEVQGEAAQRVVQPGLRGLMQPRYTPLQTGGNVRHRPSKSFSNSHQAA